MKNLIILIAIILVSCNQVNKSSESKKNSNTKLPESAMSKTNSETGTAIEKQFLVTDFETGFYDSYSVQFLPRIIMKWKNISSNPINDRVLIKGVFIENNEILSSNSDVLQYKNDIPFEPGLSKQIVFTSHAGFPNSNGYKGHKVTCRIYLNNKLYKEFKIDEKLLNHERLK